MDREIIAKELVKIARKLISANYEYRHDPDHKHRPDGKWERTERGWRTVAKKSNKVERKGTFDTGSHGQNVSLFLNYGNLDDDKSLSKNFRDFSDKMKDKFEETHPGSKMEIGQHKIIKNKYYGMNHATIEAPVSVTGLRRKTVKPEFRAHNEDWNAWETFMEKLQSHGYKHKD